ncbi:bacillithiol biosynthesis deacetylase BshB1 [Alkalicoccus halolimnae]|uniref:Bacillithiol biosynthesis deacetylase BshB1 n=1 Tax=Alkalicoccus halolimnae TaxID=1667239 RepID=A0A5C7FGZ8_9BACI|nr:bacillithiol biosynthesis deacetylase BshB1 [Alkalicoccus halolimnae]TXF82983.1 bacillithiol biosynthesis deacetylase BshB1 [Alkalicoccus halolimnae]
MKNKIISVGAHPDDVEIGMGGTIAKYINEGWSAKLVHLTKAELSSNGTVEERETESRNACEILGAEPPISLSYADRGLMQKREEIISDLVQIIRREQPEILFAPFYIDRHPDHGHCSELVKEAYFSSGIQKYGYGKAYRPSALYFYQINGMGTPDFAVDISTSVDKKYKALECFSSQFQQSKDSIKTPLNESYLEDLKSRDRLTGKEAGVSFAEGFKSESLLLHNF